MFIRLRRLHHRRLAYSYRYAMKGKMEMWYGLGACSSWCRYPRGAAGRALMAAAAGACPLRRGGRAEHDVSWRHCSSGRARTRPRALEVVPIAITTREWLLAGKRARAREGCDRLARRVCRRRRTGTDAQVPAHPEIVPRSSASEIVIRDRRRTAAAHGPTEKTEPCRQCSELAGLPYVGSGVLAPRSAWTR